MNDLSKGNPPPSRAMPAPVPSREASEKFEAQLTPEVRAGLEKHRRRNETNEQLLARMFDRRTARELSMIRQRKKSLETKLQFYRARLATTNATVSRLELELERMLANHPDP